MVYQAFGGFSWATCLKFLPSSHCPHPCRSTTPPSCPSLAGPEGRVSGGQVHSLSASLLRGSLEPIIIRPSLVTEGEEPATPVADTHGRHSLGNPSCCSVSRDPKCPGVQSPVHPPPSFPSFIMHAWSSASAQTSHTQLLRGLTERKPAPWRSGCPTRDGRGGFCPPQSH